MKRILIAALLLFLTWGAVSIAVSNCDCLPWRRDTIRVHSTSSSCKVLTTPSPWGFPSGGTLVTDWAKEPAGSEAKFNPDTMSRYEVRQDGREGYLIGLLDRGVVPPRVGGRFFRLAQSGLVESSAAEWTSASPIEPGNPAGNVSVPRVARHQFFDYGAYSSAQMGVRMTYDGPPLNPTTFGELAPIDPITPWTIQRNVLAEINLRANPVVVVAKFEFPMCGMDAWTRRGASFHGHRIFTMPLRKDGSSLLFCDFSRLRG